MIIYDFDDKLPKKFKPMNKKEIIEESLNSLNNWVPFDENERIFKIHSFRKEIVYVREGFLVKGNESNIFGFLHYLGYTGMGSEHDEMELMDNVRFNGTYRFNLTAFSGGSTWDYLFTEVKDNVLKAKLTHDTRPILSEGDIDVEYFKKSLEEEFNSPKNWVPFDDNEEIFVLVTKNKNDDEVEVREGFLKTGNEINITKFLVERGIYQSDLELELEVENISIDRIAIHVFFATEDFGGVLLFNKKQKLNK